MIIPQTQELKNVARRLVWYKSPEQALEDPYLFLAHVMTYGTLEDIITVKDSLGIAAFKEALHQLPPGIMDIKSWTYWSVVTGSTIASMPERKFS